MILNPGSGKTTHLSVLTGDHPQSYTQRGPTSTPTLVSCASISDMKREDNDDDGDDGHMVRRFGS